MNEICIITLAGTHYSGYRHSIRNVSKAGLRHYFDAGWSILFQYEDIVYLQRPRWRGWIETTLARLDAARKQSART